MVRFFWLLLAAAACVPGAAGLSLFMRTTWLSNATGDSEPRDWRSWFDLVARGRAEGPASPYFVEDLALQNTACCESHAAGSYEALGCLGPKCSDLGLEPNTLLTAELDQMSEYFHLFDRVYVGTTTWQDWDGANASSTRHYAERQAHVGRQFMARYGHLAEGPGADVDFAWYITDEGNMVSMGTDNATAAVYGAYVAESMEALTAVRPLPFLWSPYNGHAPVNASTRARQRAGLERMLCALPHPLAIHFQDCLGQSVSFDFPFSYNYSVALTCEGDTVPTYELLRQVQSACPDVLREVKVNAELFAERLAPGTGSRGEDNGANIVNADPREVADRLACYERHGVPVGACWAINHWHSLWSYANATVYAPY